LANSSEAFSKQFKKEMKRIVKKTKTRKGMLFFFSTLSSSLWRPVVNFNNILRADFAQISFLQKITNPNYYHKKTAKTLCTKRWL